MGRTKYRFAKHSLSIRIRNPFQHFAISTSPCITLVAICDKNRSPRVQRLCAEIGEDERNTRIHPSFGSREPVFVCKTDSWQEYHVNRASTNKTERETANDISFYRHLFVSHIWYPLFLIHLAFYCTIWFRTSIDGWCVCAYACVRRKNKTAFHVFLWCTIVGHSMMSGCRIDLKRKCFVAYESLDNVSFDCIRFANQAIDDGMSGVSSNCMRHNQITFPWHLRC